MSEALNSSRGLTGTWDLLAVQFEFAESGERKDLFGSSPTGRLIITETGDFMTVITSADRASLTDPARLFESMMAYSGKFRIDGDKLVISCDVSWHPSWVQSEQIRFFEVDGEKLLLRSPTQTHPRYPDKPGHGRIYWRRG